MSILNTLFATWALALTTTAEPPTKLAPDPAIVRACMAEGGSESECTQQALVTALAQACIDDGGAEEACVAQAQAELAAAAAPAADGEVVEIAEDAPAAPAAGDPEVAAAQPVVDADGNPVADAVIDPEVAAAQPEAAIAEADAPAGETMEEAHPGIDPKEYLALLREVLRAQKEKVAERLEEKIAAKQDAKMATMSSVLSWLSLAGLLLLALPLVLRKKYPGQGPLLFKYSAIAAGVCTVAIFLFAQVLLLLRGVQGALSSLTNPQVAVIDATFQVLDDNVEDLVEVGPALIEAPLAQVASGEQDSLPLAILDNVSRLNEDITVFKTIARQFEGVFAMFGYLPIVLTVVAVVLFLLSIKPVIVQIVAMPGRVASGEAQASAVIKDVFRTIGREVLATLCLIGGLIVVTIFSGIMLSFAVQPAIEAFLAYVFTSLLYTMAASDFSKFAVYASVLGALLFLVLNIAAVLVTNVLFLGKLQKICKRRFHEKVPFSAHRRFWGWGSLSLVWAHVLPLLFVTGAQEGVGVLIDSMTKGDGEPPWTALLLSGPAILVFGFIVVFWAARGLAAIRFILRYRPQDAQAAGMPGVETAGARGGTARYRSTAGER